MGWVARIESVRRKMEVTADESPPGTPGSIVLVPDTPESSAAAVHDSIVAAFGVVESDGEEDQLKWEGGAYSEVVSPPHTPTAARSDETPGSEWSENLFADVGAFVNPLLTLPAVHPRVVVSLYPEHLGSAHALHRRPREGFVGRG